MPSHNSDETNVNLPNPTHNINLPQSDDANLKPRIVYKPRSDFCLKSCFFLVGVGFLFPYNSVVTAVDYFANIYYESIDFYLGWLLLSPSLAILCITLKCGYWGSIYQRMIGCFLLEGILTIIIPLVDNVYILFIATFILGCLSAVLQGTLFSLLGFLGSDFISVTQTGIGCSGVLVGLIRIITKVFLPTDITHSTYLYFLLAFVMVLIDILIYIFVLHPSEKVQRAISQDSQKNASLHAIKVQKRKTMAPHNGISEGQSILNNNKNSNINNYNAISDKQPLIQVHRTNEKLSSGSEVFPDDNAPLGLQRLFGVTWKCQLAVFLNYTLTLSLFPGVISLMKWDNSGDAWFAVIQIFLFNFFDTIGKHLITYPWILGLWNENILLFASVLRLAFIPLFVMCVSPLIFSWQIAIVINALMGITNGLVGTTGFCLGPLSPNVPHHEKGRTSQMLAVSLTAGLVGGASLAFLINFVMNTMSP